MLWEAFSCGSPPYPGMNNQDARIEVKNNSLNVMGIDHPYLQADTHTHQSPPLPLS